jgi:lipopolysaccharide biosynthesis glycosyltransferase
MVHLLVSSNLAGFPDLLVLILSLKNVEKEALDVSLLSATLTDYDPRYQGLGEKEANFLRSLLKKNNPASELSLFDLTPQVKKDFPYLAHFSPRYTPYSLFRLYADSLPHSQEKWLYLDTDIVVMKPLDALFEMDLQGYDLALVKDPVGAPVKGKNYGNSGVLLLNLPQIKADGSFARCRQTIAQKKGGAYDQDAINHECKKLFLPEKYNEQRKTKEETVIRHYPRYLRIFPYPHDHIIRPSNPELFRAHYPHENEALLSEFEQERKRYQDE